MISGIEIAASELQICMRVRGVGFHEVRGPRSRHWGMLLEACFGVMCD